MCVLAIVFFESAILFRAHFSLRRLLLGDGIFSTLGDHHRRQRKLLNPIFSIAHMRQLTPIFYETAHRVRNTLHTSVISHLTCPTLAL